MMQKTEAIVLHSIRYGDHRLIVDMFTRSQGRLSFAVPLPAHGGSKSRVRKQLFQPLTLLNIETDIRPTKQLQRLSDVSILLPYSTLQSDPSKLAIALFVAEFLYHALRGELRDELLFDYIRSGMEWLDSCQAHYANFHLVFLMRLSRFLGFQPNLELTGDYFDLRAAAFCVHPPLHRDFLQPEEAAHIRLLMRMDFATMHLFRLNHHERTRILEVIILYYRLHLPQFPELRSLSVLTELFN